MLDKEHSLFKRYFDSRPFFLNFPTSFQEKNIKPNAVGEARSRQCGARVKLELEFNNGCLIKTSYETDIGQIGFFMCVLSLDFMKRQKPSVLELQNLSKIARHNIKNKTFLSEVYDPGFNLLIKSLQDYPQGEPQSLVMFDALDAALINFKEIKRL